MLPRWLPVCAEYKHGVLTTSRAWLGAGSVPGVRWPFADGYALTKLFLKTSQRLPNCGSISAVRCSSVQGSPWLLRIPRACTSAANFVPEGSAFESRCCKWHKKDGFQCCRVKARVEDQKCSKPTWDLGNSLTMSSPREWTVPWPRRHLMAFYQPGVPESHGLSGDWRHWVCSLCLGLECSCLVLDSRVTLRSVTKGASISSRVPFGPWKPQKLPFPIAGMRRRRVIQYG